MKGRIIIFWNIKKNMNGQKTDRSWRETNYNADSFLAYVWFKVWGPHSVRLVRRTAINSKA